jgi:(p)ppGpp synthase/HD superfamily hydrolase
MKFQTCIYSERLLHYLSSLNTAAIHPVDLTEIRKAIFYARKYHGHQRRQSGEPYYSHPLAVAYMLAEYTAEENKAYFRTDLLVTAILHDTL